MALAGQTEPVPMPLKSYITILWVLKLLTSISSIIRSYMSKVLIAACQLYLHSSVAHSSDSS